MKKYPMLWVATLLMSAVACLSASAQNTVVNGVAHSELYPGATLDLRVNACIRDAETGANGAVSHVCDSSGDGGTQTIAGQINVGDAAGDPVTWLLPGAGTWNVTSAVGASNSAIFQYSFTHIHGTSMPPNRLQITNTASSGGIFALYTNSANSSTGFYWADGFALRNTTGTTTSGAVMLIPGGFDTSTISYVAVESYVPGTTGIRVGGTNSLCCSAAFDHVTVYDNNTGGIPIDIEGNGAHESFGVWFYASSFGHPAPGLPILKCNDTSSVKQTSIGLFGVYEEGLGAAMTVPVNQVTGCASVIAHGNTIAAITSAASAVGWSIDPSFATSLDITGLDMGHGFAHPAKAIVNGASGSTVLTDANGSLTHYASNIDYADNVSAFGTVNAGTGFTIGGNPLSFAHLSGSVPTSQLPAASNSAMGIAQCDGTTVTCASGVISAVGGGSITGIGAVNSISRWTGTSTQGMSSITDNGATVATVESLSLGAAPALSGQVRLPTGAAISWRNNQNTADVPAVIFGNGNTLFLGHIGSGVGSIASQANHYFNSLVVHQLAAVATSTDNFSSPNESTCGLYWTGSASATDCYTWQNVVPSTGTNPATVLTLAAAGSTGAHSVSIPVPLSAAAFGTVSNCSSSASPADCGSAPSGAVAIAVGATSAEVNTTAVTMGSRILLTADDTVTIPGVTCNSTIETLVGGLAITARTPGTGFTISINGKPISRNPLCVSYTIIN